MKLIKHIVVIFVLLAGICSSAQEEPVLTFNIPTQNNLMFNRYFINPAFTSVRQEDAHVTMYHRNQWIQFNDSPELYLLSYSGKFGERSGAGIGLYQQNLGILTSFGGITNYSYQVRLRENMVLTGGFNLAYYSTGINSGRVVSNEPDPALLGLSNTSLLTLKPGINLTWGSFDVGVYAENLVDYDFKTNKMVQEYGNKTYSGHLMYHHQMNNQSGLFEDGYFRLMLRGRANEIEDFTYGGSLIVNFPYLGWVQAGLDDYFGVGVGVGAHLTQRLSLGYVYERVINEGLVNFGPTHEIVLSFRFATKNSQTTTRAFDNTKKQTQPIAKKQVVAQEEIVEYEEDEEEDMSTVKIKVNRGKYSTTPKNQVDSEETYLKKVGAERALELEKLRMTLDEDYVKLVDMIEEKDQLETIRQDAFEQKIENLMQYIQRLEKTLAEKADKDDCQCEETVQTVVTTETTTVVKPKSATNETQNKIPNTKTDESKNDLATKLSALKSGSAKDNAAQKFSLTEDEIKEYYSKLTTKQRSTAKRNYLEIPGQEPGHYIIANVFSEPTLADQFIQQLKKQKIAASYFINPKNNYRYVYLKKLPSWNDALIAYYSNVDNTYFETIWIMNINIK
ncbi:MAG: PorP/SprF family type IX secretion system membrane protein [Flavobacterium sp.]